MIAITGAIILAISVGTIATLVNFSAQLDHEMQAIPHALKGEQETPTFWETLTGTEPQPKPQPVVSLLHAGSLNQNEQEKARLRKMLIEPFIAYRGESGVEYAAIVITVPPKVGGAYMVTATDMTGDTEEFSFGAREKDFGYWVPACGGGCSFSESFRAKYPDIVNPAK